MRQLATMIVVVALCAVSPAEAQQASAADYRPLEFLVGSCWKGNFPDGRTTDEHCFEWMYDKKFIRDKHVVRGGAPYQGETVYGWDPVAKQPTYTYWSSEGFIITGKVVYSPDGIVFPSQYSTDKGVVEIKAVWTKVGTDGYRVQQNQKADGAWKVQWTMALTRVAR